MLTFRLIVGAVFLVAGANQLKADDSFTCPVTKASEQTFALWGAGPWFGTEKLWTRVEYWEHWQKDELGYYVPKVAWFSKTFDWTPEHWPHERLLTIRGRLDGPSKPLTFEGANNAYIPGKPFITASVHVPTAGCWEITGRSKGENMTFVVKIVP
jgi:hypothetical protein